MNPRSAILDTGLLVAALDRQDTHHAWAKSILLAVPAPAITCEAVITETLFLLSRISGGEQAVFGLLRKQVLQINFALDVEYATIDRLMQTYRSVPMSLADACLVRMSELYPSYNVITLDRDFEIYRRNRNQLIPVIMPDRS
jgi:uncharacterized protein